ELEQLDLRLVLDRCDHLVVDVGRGHELDRARLTAAGQPAGGGEDRDAGGLRGGQAGGQLVGGVGLHDDGVNAALHEVLHRGDGLGGVAVGVDLRGLPADALHLLLGGGALVERGDLRRVEGDDAHLEGGAALRRRARLIGGRGGAARRDQGREGACHGERADSAEPTGRLCDHVFSCLMASYEEMPHPIPTWRQARRGPFAGGNRPTQWTYDIRVRFGFQGCFAGKMRRSRRWASQYRKESSVSRQSWKPAWRSLTVLRNFGGIGSSEPYAKHLSA